jgi:hypothetical protein
VSEDSEALHTMDETSVTETTNATMPDAEKVRGIDRLEGGGGNKGLGEGGIHICLNGLHDDYHTD